MLAQKKFLVPNTIRRDTNNLKDLSSPWYLIGGEFFFVVVKLLPVEDGG